MLEMLFDTAAARGLMTGLRVGPKTDGQYRLAIWIGPRVGERYEWSRGFPASIPLSESLAAITHEALSYCEQHDWGGGWAASQDGRLSAEAPAGLQRRELVSSAA
jgi:hypothetical protein